MLINCCFFVVGKLLLFLQEKLSAFKTRLTLQNVIGMTCLEMTFFCIF